MAAPRLDPECCIDYLSIIHRNMYRMPSDPDTRVIFKKYLRLIDDELDANLGVPGPLTPPRPQAWPQPQRK